MQLFTSSFKKIYDLKLKLIEEIEHVLRAFGRIREQISAPAREFPQTLPRFSPGYEGTDNMFYFFFTKLLFSDLTKRKTMYEARMYTLISFMKLKNLKLGDNQLYCLRHFRTS